MSVYPLLFLLVVGIIQLVFLSLAQHASGVVEFFGKDTIGGAAVWILGFTMLWFAQVTILWAAWKFYFKPSHERQRIYGVSYINCWSWLLCLLYFPAAILYFSALGLGGYFDHSNELKTIHPIIFIFGAALTISGASLALRVVYNIASELLAKFSDFIKLRKVFNARHATETEKIAFSDALYAEFCKLLESEVEQAFFAVGFQYGKWLILLDRIGEVARGDNTSVTVDRVVNQCSVILGSLSAQFPGINFKVINVHSHPSMRPQYVSRDADEALNYFEAGVADGSYHGVLLGMIRNWLSQEDRNIIRRFSNSIGILVWGIQYDSQKHYQLRPDYDVVAIRAAATVLGDDAIIPLHHFEKSEIQRDFAGSFGKKLMAAISNAIEEKNQQK